jgi:predicted DCC family thiol-disulfide oxidoreductase YuxK
MGWTGVQYSALRVATALCVAAVCLRRLSLVEGITWLLLAIALPAAIGLLLGWRDRALALVLLGLVTGVAAFVDGAPLVLPERDVILTSALLGLHALAPAAPFGSMDARDRMDPRGGWERPAWIGRLAWLVLALAHGLRVLARQTGSSLAPGLDAAPWPGALEAIVAGIDVLFIAATILPRLRAPAWIAAFALELAFATVPPHGPGVGAFLLLHLFAAEPAWWPGRPLARHRPIEARGGEPARLYYDGDCGFCHRAVRIVLSEDANTPAPLALRFAPLGGPTFGQQVRDREDVRPEALPDSIVLVLEDGRLLTRSAAALEIASRLGGLWRALALIGGALPTGPLDAAYDAVARIRSKLFARPDDACPILPPDLRRRFDR